MSSDTASTFTSAPTMSAEAGFDGNDIQAPIRISGFLSLLFGLISILSFIGVGLLFAPLLGVAFGVVGLRKFGTPKPVGIMAAQIGVLLSVGFGAFGLGVPMMKKHTLSTQGEHYAREYMKLVAMGEDYYALELKKTFNNRFLSTMPLEQYYTPEPDKPKESAVKLLAEFRDEGVYSVLRDVGPDGEWEVDRAINVYYQYGRDHIDIVFANYDNPNPRLVRVILECTKHPRTGDLEWHVATCMIYRDRIVAETVL